LPRHPAGVGLDGGGNGGGGQQTQRVQDAACAGSGAGVPSTGCGVGSGLHGGDPFGDGRRSAGEGGVVDGGGNMVGGALHHQDCFVPLTGQHPLPGAGVTLPSASGIPLGTDVFQPRFVQNSEDVRQVPPGTDRPQQDRECRGAGVNWNRGQGPGAAGG